MRAALPLCIAIVAAACGSPPPTVPPGALGAPFLAVGPAVASRRGRDVQVALVLTNPSEQPIELTGYASDSFDPPLGADELSPLYRRQRWDVGGWSDDPPGFCGTGVTRIVVPPRSARRFDVLVQPDARVRVGVAYTLGQTEHVAWSTALPPR